MELSQIVITCIEEPVDTPRGEVFKIAIFDRKECVDVFHCDDEAGTVDLIRMYLEDLRSV